MDATRAYETGGWPLFVAAILIAAIVYLAADNRILRKRIDQLSDETRTMLQRAQERDAEELKELRRERESGRR